MQDVCSLRHRFTGWRVRLWGIVIVGFAYLAGPIMPENAATVWADIVYSSASPPPTGLPPRLTLSPYNRPAPEFDLWRIEATKFVRGPIIVAPNGSSYVYAEVMYLPGTRQVNGALHAVTPSKGAGIEAWQPTQTQAQRKTLWRVGDEKPEAFAFSTIQVVDWSANSQKLLLRRRQGLLYTGLRTSDTLIYDFPTNTLTRYGEIPRALHDYWRQKVGLAHPIFALAWEVQPLGFAGASGHVVQYQAVATGRKVGRIFLGYWEYDTQRKAARLVSESESVTVRVSSRGWQGIVTPEPHSTSLPHKKPSKVPTWIQRIRRSL
jgi:hypothetical protein